MIDYVPMTLLNAGRETVFKFYYLELSEIVAVHPYAMPRNQVQTIVRGGSIDGNNYGVRWGLRYAI
jgi:hypothetical protein